VKVARRIADLDERQPAQREVRGRPRGGGGGQSVAGDALDLENVLVGRDQNEGIAGWERFVPYLERDVAVGDRSEKEVAV
jgi:hypothetical protein